MKLFKPNAVFLGTCFHKILDLKHFLHNLIQPKVIEKSPQTSFPKNLVIKVIWFTPIIIMAVIVVACNKISTNVFDAGVKEGIIEYKVSFPEMDASSLTATLMPDKMTYAFTKNAFASYFEAAGGVFKNRILADKDKKTVEQQLKVFRKKVKVDMDESDVLQMVAKYPKITVVKTQEVDTIAGFPCNKAVIVFEDASKSDIEVYYTNAIEMDNPNWCTQYHDIEGVLMAYEIEQFGIRMRLVATSVEAKKIGPELLQPEGDFTPISRETMDIEIAQLVETFEL